MAKVKIELNSAGVQELLKSNEIISLMQEKAHNIIGNLDGDYEVSTHTGKTRANVSIYTTDSKTFHNNLKNNELLKGLH